MKKIDIADLKKDATRLASAHKKDVYATQDGQYFTENHLAESHNRHLKTIDSNWDGKVLKFAEVEQLPVETGEGKTAKEPAKKTSEKTTKEPAKKTSEKTAKEAAKTSEKLANEAAKTSEKLANDQKEKTTVEDKTGEASGEK